MTDKSVYEEGGLVKLKDPEEFFFEKQLKLDHVPIPKLARKETKRAIEEGKVHTNQAAAENILHCLSHFGLTKLVSPGSGPSRS